MAHEYAPKLDDAMTRALGNARYTQDVAGDARRAAEAAYLRAVQHKSAPFFKQYDLPVGKGIKQKLRAKYMMRHSRPIHPITLYSQLGSKWRHGAGLTKLQRSEYKIKRDNILASMKPAERDSWLYKEAQRKIKAKQRRMAKALYAMDPVAHPLGPKYDRKAAMKARWKAIKADPEELAAISAKISKGRKDKYLARGVSASSPEEIAVMSHQATAAASPAYYSTKHPESLVVPQSGFADKLMQGEGFSKKLAKINMKAAMGDPKALQRLDMMRRLTTGKGCKAGLLAARGMLSSSPIHASPAGGFIGTALSLGATALPLILEGIKWISKKIQEKKAAKQAKLAMGSGRADGIWLGVTHELPGDLHPRNASDFWRRVYKIAANEMPLHFKKRSEATAAADEFLQLHGREFFYGLQNKVLAERAKFSKQPTQAEVIAPVIEAAAEKSGAKSAEASEILATPALQSPAGEGFMDSILEVLKSPAVRGIVSEGAKTLLPIVTDKIKSFAKARMLKLRAKHPKTAGVIEKIGAPLAQQAEKAVKSAVSGISGTVAELPKATEATATSTGTGIGPASADTSQSVVATSSSGGTSEGKRLVSTPLTASTSSVGPTSADSFTRGGRLASRVYSMAKN